MARYIMKEMPDLRKTGKRVTYPAFERIDHTDLKELARRVSAVSGFSAGNVEGVLLQTAIEMSGLMAEGRSVKIDGIGTFTPSLSLIEGKEREAADGSGTRRNAQSICVGKVNFRVDRELIRNINRRCLLERTTDKRKRIANRYTPEERLAMALRYLDTHPYLTVQEYRKLTGMARSSATTELNRWATSSDPEIDTRGRGSHKVYIKKEKGEDTTTPRS